MRRVDNLCVLCYSGEGEEVIVVKRSKAGGGRERGPDRQPKDEALSLKFIPMQRIPIEKGSLSWQ
jgi:hypothetical protein